MKLKTLIISLLAFFSIGQIVGQEKLSLEQIIELAKSKSPNYLRVANIKKNRFWQYRTFKADYGPQLVLQGNLPNFNRAIQGIALPDGRQAFVSRSFMSNRLQLGLIQQITATGGSVSVSTALERIDILGDQSNTSYLSTPFFITLNQPLFQFNDLQWNKKIQPLRYEESIKRYNEDLEVISIQASNLFFNALSSQILYEVALRNKANNDTIFTIAKGRYEMGKIAENELLQLELNSMNSAQQVTQARLDFENNSLALRNYVGPSNLAQNFSLFEPETIPDFEIDENMAISQARSNRQAFIEFKRRVLEAERDVAQARRGGQGVNLEVTGALGFNQSAPSLGGAYQGLQDQQIFNVNLRVPILDWGRQKARTQTALANEEVVKTTVVQDELNFEQEIFTKVRLFKILRERLNVGIKADEIAQKRYDISQQRYLIGKISITDLVIALQEKDQAKQTYITALSEFWRAYFEIRQLTLYDFERNEPIGTTKP
ncbi:MAG: TolC family protein [Microscillaceae bacterium]|jgi:outer membrane protein TolC|nr:TolC family protein [Microscillaceae bacterium]